ncbi:carbohydrate ABC transporter permease [Jeongeupia chitinilytica]|uniref:ABC transporter permease n=1 Tax=Jeongeupia chitinilytica TaxID=1041641 RepID=A0ABQ3GXY7_9NEIS|nr:carbohydrate ABC transporter permease [Jeongeupia chitinilytica]GHD56749.1 ABC transporter permease [Jeongeupia chitinilytica]
MNRELVLAPPLAPPRWYRLRRQLRDAVLALPRYAALLLFGAFTVFPFWWATAAALSSDGAGIWIFPAAFLPNDPGLRWFGRVFYEMPFWRYFGNSLLISTATTLLVLLLTIPCAYALSRMAFRGRNALFVLLLVTLMVPAEVAIVPNFITCAQLGLLDSYVAVVLPNVAGAFGVFLMRQAFQDTPAEVLDAARVDGAGEFGVMCRVAVPMARPMIATLAVFTFVAAWNDYLWPAVVLKERLKMPLAVGIFNDLTGPFAVSTNLVMAAIVLSVIPVVGAFALTQRFFLSGGGLVRR